MTYIQIQIRITWTTIANHKKCFYERPLKAMPFLFAGLVALKDCVHLSPLKPSISTAGTAEVAAATAAAVAPGSTTGPGHTDHSPGATSADPGATAEHSSGPKDQPMGEKNGEQRHEADKRKKEDEKDEAGRRERKQEEEDEDESGGPLTISDLVYSPCASMLPTPVGDDDSEGGAYGSSVASMFQSPARILRDLHADPDMQQELRAEREREASMEALRVSMRPSAVSPRWGQMRACCRSAAKLVAVVSGLLLLLLPFMLLLLESDLDVAFLHDIRQTPEFQQFHYDYYCPMRRWLLCELDMLLEAVVGD